MSSPRHVIPGRCYMITRRCTRRMFLLRPDKVTNRSFAYCLAMAAKKHGIEVHWVAVMSNHYHAGIRDVRGEYPEFIRYLHSLLARCLNAHRGRWENFWATEPTSAVHLADDEAVFAKQIYGLTNPVKDHLVDKCVNWPGLSSLGHQLRDKPLTVKRPTHFFRADGRMPKDATLEFVRPPAFADLSHEAWTARLREAIADVEQRAANERLNSPRRVLGRKAVLRQSPHASPRVPARRRGLRPRFATRNKSLREDLVGRDKSFVRDYRLAWSSLQAGDRRVLFPYGTYKLYVSGVVDVKAAPA